MRATLKDIAERAGVSKSLVSMHLNGYPLAARIAASTKVKIDEAVAALGYSPSFTARALVRGRTKTLGLLVGAISNEYFSHLAEAALEEADARGYQLLVSLTKWNAEERCLRNLLDRQVDGVLMACSIPSFKPSCPLLLLQRTARGFSSVSDDTGKAVADSVKALAACGHSEICALLSLEDRWFASFEEACRKESVRPLPLCRDIGSKEGRAAAVDEVVRLRPPALLSSGRKTTEALLRKLQGPMDIVMNYDVRSYAIEDERVIGVVHCKSGQLVKTAVAKLISLVEGDGVRERIGIPAEFVPRKGFGILQGDGFESKDDI